MATPEAPIIPDVVKGGYWLASTNDVLPLANIDATLFTHLFVGYASVDSTTYKVTIDPSQDILINEFSSTVKMRNQDVKTLLSIQGDSAVFAKIAKEPTNRDVFIKSSIKVARDGKFDGLDLQWLYPSSPEEMKDFETLLNLWRKAVAKDATNLSLPELLLVATVSNVPYLIHNIQYPVQAIKQKLSWVNVISYDFYTPSSSNDATGPSSAFHNPRDNSLSAQFGIQSWIQALGKLPHKQIVFGIPFHGWAWKLANSHQHQVFSKAEGVAQGDNILPNGQIYYSNVIQFIDDNQAEVESSDKSFVIAYTYSGTTWITYESEYTIANKISLAKSIDALGYFATNIAADDAVNTLANAAKSNW